MYDGNCVLVNMCVSMKLPELAFDREHKLRTYDLETELTFSCPDKKRLQNHAENVDGLFTVGT